MNGTYCCLSYSQICKKNNNKSSKEQRAKSPISFRLFYCKEKRHLVIVTHVEWKYVGVGYVCY
jgi:hypothetical protein